jgi:hypothetical protein
MGGLKIMTKRRVVRASLTTMLLLCFIVVSAMLLVFSKTVILASAATADSEVVMNTYIANNTPSNYQKIDGVKTVTYNESQEKWQLIRTKATTEQAFNLAQEVITSANIVKGSSFTLAAGNSSSTSTMRGGYFNVAVGVGIEQSIPIEGTKILEAQVVAEYNREKVNTTTLEQARSVSFTVSNVQTTGTWALQQVITKYDYKLMRFKRTPHYATENVYDKNGKVTGTNQYIDYYEWTYYSATTYSSNQSEFFRIQKIA